MLLNTVNSNANSAHGLDGAVLSPPVSQVQVAARSANDFQLTQQFDVDCILQCRLSHVLPLFSRSTTPIRYVRNSRLWLTLRDQCLAWKGTLLSVR